MFRTFNVLVLLIFIYNFFVGLGFELRASTYKTDILPLDPHLQPVLLNLPEEILTISLTMASWASSYSALFLAYSSLKEDNSLQIQIWYYLKISIYLLAVMCITQNACRIFVL
jgi:hypothetical protein